MCVRSHGAALKVTLYRRLSGCAILPLPPACQTTLESPPRVAQGGAHEEPRPLKSEVAAAGACDRARPARRRP